jgi:alanine racemase
VNNTLRPSRVEINLGALKNNLAVVKKWAGAQSRVMAVVKADAYGHGAVKVSQAITEAGVDFLGVAFLEEACELQANGITAPIVILYPEAQDRAVEAVKQGFHITLTDMDQFKAIRASLNGTPRKINYFLKVESGMHRYGMPAEEVTDVVTHREAYPDGAVMGITTNLADSTSSNSDMAHKQVAEFMRVMDTIKHSSNNGLYYSLESSGTLWMNKHAEGTLVRVGHLLYGLVPGGGTSSELEPVMSVKSRIAEIHDVKAGEGVGYGFTYVAPRDSRVATIPMGYADGYSWALSNKGSVIIRGRRAPVVGRVCMDAFMIDITDIPDAAEGDEIVILGKMGNEKIDAHELGRWAGSFSYEILSGWSKRLPRIYQ